MSGEPTRQVIPVDVNETVRRHAIPLFHLLFDAVQAHARATGPVNNIDVLAALRVFRAYTAERCNIAPESLALLEQHVDELVAAAAEARKAGTL